MQKRGHFTYQNTIIKQREMKKPKQFAKEYVKALQKNGAINCRKVKKKYKRGALRLFNGMKRNGLLEKFDILCGVNLNNF